MAAPPPPAPPPVPLADLPVDIQRQILRRIPCSVDRGRMSAVCRAWRKMMRVQQSRLVGRPLPLPPRLPWLLLPPPAPFAAGPTRAACVLSACRVPHYLVFPPEVRFFGSHECAWLFLRSPEPVLLNVRTGGARGPPNDPRARDMVFLAAALSAPPEDPLCVVGAIVASWIDEDDPAAAQVPLPLLPRQCRMALWIWERPDALDIGSADMAEDVTYHEGAFLFLTVNEHLRVVTPVMNLDGELGVQRGIRLFKPHGGEPGDYKQEMVVVHARYLVASRDELLLVVRLRPHAGTPWTSAFKVFLATELKKPVADAKFPNAVYTWTWSELDTLGGRMLFVGRGCSRSYMVDDYPGFKDGVYFLDDMEFNVEMKIFDGNAIGQYRCSDNGKWSDGQVQHCFPRTDPSEQSPPAWLLP